MTLLQLEMADFASLGSGWADDDADIRVDVKTMKLEKKREVLRFLFRITEPTLNTCSPPHLTSIERDNYSHTSLASDTLEFCLTVTRWPSHLGVKCQIAERILNVHYVAHC